MALIIILFVILYFGVNAIIAGMLERAATLKGHGKDAHASLWFSF